MRRSTVVSLLAVAAIGVIVALTRTGPSGDEALVRLSGEALGTTWNVVLAPAADAVGADAMRVVIEKAMAGVNASMSAFSPDSDVSRFNGHKGTDWFPVGRDTAGVVSLALDIGERSGGALDITVAPLVNLWSFGWKKQPDAAPSDEDIADALRHVGLGKLEARLDPPALRKLDPELTIDLAAVAKGYAVDVVSRTLEANGAVAYLVDIGGELRVAGRKPGGDPWLVGIEKPVSDKRAVQRTIGFTDNSMATSGSYRNYFEQNGERFSHLLDPRSGRPIRHRLVSASVVDPSCAFADAWATALMVLGPSEGLAVAEREGLAALLIVNTDGGFVESLSSSFSAVETPRGSKS